MICQLVSIAGCHNHITSSVGSILFPKAMNMEVNKKKKDSQDSLEYKFWCTSFLSLIIIYFVYFYILDDDKSGLEF